MIPAELAPEDEDQVKWWHLKGSDKVYHDWMVPPRAQDDAMEAVLQEAHREMERAVEEVAFDCYI